MSAKVGISSAAVRGATGHIFRLPRPRRHGDILNIMAELGEDISPDRILCGFILSDNHTFVDRVDAFRIAKAAGQLEGRKVVMDGRLFSEDVWDDTSPSIGA